MFYGTPILRMPNLNRLHEQAVRFMDFHVSPFFTSTRPVLMTSCCSTHRLVPHIARPHSHPRPRGPNSRHFRGQWLQYGDVWGIALFDNYPSSPVDNLFKHADWHCCRGVAQIYGHFGNDNFDDKTVSGSSRIHVDSLIPRYTRIYTTFRVSHCSIPPLDSQDISGAIFGGIASTL